MARRQHSNRESGQTLVEFALTMPLLLLLIFGVIDFGRTVFALSQIIDASRQGVRFGIVEGPLASNPQYLDCAGIETAVRAVPGFVDLQNMTIQISYENPDGTPKFPCTTGLTKLDVLNGDVLAVRVTGDLIPITPVIMPFTDRFTFEYTARRSVLAVGTESIEEWPSNPARPSGFAISAVDCFATQRNVSFTWNAMDPAPDRMEIRNAITNEPVAVQPFIENAFCMQCADYPGQSNAYYYLVTFNGGGATEVMGPASNIATASCPEKGSITITAFLDSDRNGSRKINPAKSAEPLIPNVLLTAYWAGPDNVLDTGDERAISALLPGTDSNGQYKFDNMLPGLYRIQIQTPQGALQPNICDTTTNPRVVTLDPGQDLTGLMFGFTQPPFTTPLGVICS